ncbi:MAG: cytochrome P450 [Candidatus Eremiobacteraeota bacterium]|nr:cytochrome P450 [Candidatus Eremiobacteraeota bacterium]
MQIAELPYLDFKAPDLSVTSESFRALRASHWMARSDMGYAVLRYADCAAMLRDGRLQQASRVILAMRGVTEGPLVDWWTGTMLNMDGAEHTRLRRLVAKAFTPPMVERLRPYFRATAERLVAEFRADGRCEFMSAFSEPYPLEGICEMLGVPHDRRSAFYGWASDLGLIFSQHIGEPETRERAETALLALYACADDVIADRRVTPGDDLVSALVAAEAEGERLTDAELRSMVVGLIFAGNDTTRNQMALGIIAFSEHSEQWTRLREKPELASRAIDEMMRLQPTISLVSRIASDEVTYHGVAFPRGTLFQLFLASANADEDVFGPAPFDITTERPAQHLTFSGGIHRCLGMWLARAEMEEALAVLSTRFRSIVRDGEPTWQVGLGIDGPTTLPLRFQ